MGEREKIFLIEDDRNLRRSLVRLLESQHHRVVAEAASMSDVHEIVLSSDIEFGIAIIDGEIGDESGDSVSEVIRSEKRDVKIVSYAFEEQKFGDINLTKFQGPKVLLETVRQI